MPSPTSRQAHILRTLVEQAGYKNLTSFMSERVPDVSFRHISALAAKDELLAAKPVTLEKLAKGLEITLVQLQDCLMDGDTSMQLSSEEWRLFAELRLIRKRAPKVYNAIETIIDSSFAAVSTMDSTE